MVLVCGVEFIGYCWTVAERLPAARATLPSPLQRLRLRLRSHPSIIKKQRSGDKDLVLQLGHRVLVSWSQQGDHSG